MFGARLKFTLVYAKNTVENLKYGRSKNKYRISKLPINFSKLPVIALKFKHSRSNKYLAAKYLSSVQKITAFAQATNIRSDNQEI